MVFDLRDGRKGYLDDLSVCTQDFDAWRRERLGVLHAANRTADPPAVGSNDFHVVFTIKRLQSRQRLGYFHLSHTSMRLNEPVAKDSLNILPFNGGEVYRVPLLCNRKRLFGV